uniref:Kinesin family member 16Bb n=2 Tax=Mastacembelus armatus TaxID=205130 RepID=A0A3Q3MND4_9TELE
MGNLIVFGNANRTTASTNMNDFSSRSHAIFTISFSQAWFDMELPRETLSKIHLVDLAGSERADATRTTGTRLKEGAKINKSLVTLGSVISALADLSVGGQSAKKKQIFIPYRDSVLTWLLKDSLGGNSVTTMIATISPADVSYGETLSTLRYASRAKNIVNSPTVNEDDRVKVIRELQAEVTRLRKLLEEANQISHLEQTSCVKVEEELQQNESKVLALTREWTIRWGEVLLQEETVALRKQGSGVVLDCQLPHLIGISEDLLRTGIVLYYLKEGGTLIGTDKASCSQDIGLQGPGLLSERCVLENCGGTVTLIPQDGAPCSVNGSVVTEPCLLTQGAIIQLGKGTILRFNHPTEATHVRENGQSGLLSAVSLSLTDMSRSTENLSNVKLQNPSLMDMQATETAEPNVPSSCVASATAEKILNAAIPGKYPLPDCFELDRDSIQGGVSTRDGQEQESDLCHKSGPGLMSEQPGKKTQSEAGVASHGGEKVWSRDASLWQMSVLGPGDGCGMKAEGNANEIQDVAADCYKGRPGPEGSSLHSMSHLQSSREAISTSLLPQTCTCPHLDKTPLSSQVACCPPEETTIERQFSCGELAEPEGVEEIKGVYVMETAAATAQNSRLGSLVSRVSWIVQDAGRLLWSSPTVLQQVRKEGLQPVGARWSSHVVSLVKESNVLSTVKDSHVYSMVKGSFVFSLFKDSYIFSLVKDLPLLQHIQMTDRMQHLEADEAQTFSKSETLPDNEPINQEHIWKKNKTTGDVQLSQEQDVDDIHVQQGDKLMAALSPMKRFSEPEVNQGKEQPLENSWMVQNKNNIQIFSQTLIEFPDFLLNLRTLPFLHMMDALQSAISISTLTSQKILAFYWLSVAKCSQPDPRPGLLILVETGLYTLTTDSEFLVLFHHLPLLQLKEVQIGLAGHSLRLMGSTEESILGVYTHSQELTKELCWAILGVICPRDSRVSQHPLLHGDLLKMSLDWQTHVPDLLLDAGLRVCCQFQKSLADLVYLLHCNMDQSQETIHMGEVQILMYTSVGVCISPCAHTEPLAWLLLTDTHLGLLQEDAVFHPSPHCVNMVPCRPQFHDLILRQRSDIRCVLLRDEKNRGAVGLDIILTNVKGRGHPGKITKAATLPAYASNSSLHAEVWKLTFSCSTEAACLINHLSNV